VALDSARSSQRQVPCERPRTAAAPGAAPWRPLCQARLALHHGLDEDRNPTVSRAIARAPQPPQYGVGRLCVIYKAPPGRSESDLIPLAKSSSFRRGDTATPALRQDRSARTSTIRNAANNPGLVLSDWRRSGFRGRRRDMAMLWHTAMATTVGGEADAWSNLERRLTSKALYSRSVSCTFVWNCRRTQDVLAA